MARKKAKKMVESDSDMGLDGEMNAGITHVRPLVCVNIHGEFFPYTCCSEYAIMF